MVQASWLSSSSAWTHSLAVPSVRHTHTHSLSLSFSHTVISICAPCGVNWRCDKAYQQQNSVPYWRRSAAVARSTCTAHIIMTPANVLHHVKSSYTFILSCKFTAERCLIWKWLLVSCALYIVILLKIGNGWLLAKKFCWKLCICWLIPQIAAVYFQYTDNKLVVCIKMKLELGLVTLGLAVVSLLFSLALLCSY